MQSVWTETPQRGDDAQGIAQGLQCATVVSRDRARVVNGASAHGRIDDAQVNVAVSDGLPTNQVGLCGDASRRR